MEKSRLELLKQLGQGTRWPCQSWDPMLLSLQAVLFPHDDTALLKSHTLPYEKICVVLTWLWGMETLKTTVEEFLVSLLREVISACLSLSLPLL